MSSTSRHTDAISVMLMILLEASSGLQLLSEVVLLRSSGVPDVVVQLFQRKWFEYSQVTWRFFYLLLLLNIVDRLESQSALKQSLSLGQEFWVASCGARLVAIENIFEFCAIKNWIDSRN